MFWYDTLACISILSAKADKKLNQNLEEYDLENNLGLDLHFLFCYF